MLVGSLLTFIAAIITFRFSAFQHFSFSAFPYFSFSKKALTQLLFSAPFWFSFLFLIYISIQALNPSVAVVSDESGWWVESTSAPFGEAWPSSVRSDYNEMNAFRVLKWFAASFLLMWGILIGISRRKAASIILWSLILSGSGMAFVAILQDMTEADKVLWTLKSSNEQFWGSFFYRNQGVAYLNGILIGTGVLYFYYAKRAIERAQHGGPHFLLFLLFALVASSVGLALSRGGILVASILTIGFLFLLMLQRVFAVFSTRNSWAIAGITGFVLVGGAYGIGKQVDLKAIEERFGDVGATIDNAESDARMISSKATWDMAQDRLWLGWGAGSFRYIFPIYQHNYPELFYSRYHKKKDQWMGRKVFHYAHNDILQFLAEYGIIGCSLLLLSLATLLFPVVRQLFSASSLQSLFLILGLATIAAHAFLEFILNSPAYWVAMVGLLAALAKLFELEWKRRFAV